MTIETIKGDLIELTYDTDSYRTIRSEIQLGDSLFAKFDEKATYITYKFVQHLATTKGIEELLVGVEFVRKQPSLLGRLNLFKAKNSKDSKTIPTTIIDLYPAHVCITPTRVKELYADFENIFRQVKSSIVWPDDGLIQ